MDTHVKVLGILQILLGALGIVVALIVMMVFGGIASLIGVSGEEGAQIAAPIMLMIGTVAMFFLLIMAVPGIICGIGLLKFRPWARILGLILSILLLIHIPLGTIVGVYGLWVLFTKETEKLFEPKAAT